MGDRYLQQKLGNKLRRFFKKSPLTFLRSSFNIFYNYLSRYLGYFYFKYLNLNRFFIFQGKKYRYFYHLYNFSHRNERCVEIAIAQDIIGRYEGKNILELGNVLSYYLKHSGDILDKYENKKGIIQKDIIDFHPDKKYDLIISISTLEHIGRDDGSNDQDKIFLVIGKLKNILAPGAKLFFTLPIGYNQFLDKYIKEEKLDLSEKYFMKRISKDNRWQEVDKEEALQQSYGRPYNAGNAIMIGIIKNI
ncbi:MAG: hypothetical protein Q8O32_03825 [bacterium]|nr:hypothetical protein [bacterium]